MSQIITRERGITMSEPNIAPLMADRKTQTRRIMKFQPTEQPELFTASRDRAGLKPVTVAAWGDNCCIFPYGNVGETLYVKEAYRISKLHDNKSPADLDQAVMVFYEADGLPRPEWAGRYRHARFMPRWAARISREITAIGVERLQDISDEDALAEGIYPTLTGLYPGSPRNAYCKLWESLHGPGSWSLNPWVWVITFRKM